jgi:F420-non-reducing hydrogenase iron-sulfur subunit
MPDSTEITMFVCANCARPGKKTASGSRARPAVPDFDLPGRVQQIIVPCTGRLQPEHILKAFESGSSLVSVVACREDNCHFVEGSRRCALRLDFIRSILKEIGLGEERLLLSHLPGSASEDMALAAGMPAPVNGAGSLAAQIASIRDQAVQALRCLPPNPLLQFSPASLNGDAAQQEFNLGEDDGDE